LVILGAVFDGESSNEQEKLSPAAPEQEQRFSELRHYVPADLLDVSFPVSVRGYDRRAVDAHIKRVNRVIAELKVRSSPPAAVRHALEQAGEKVQGLLQAAREAAEEITASARLEAEESTARAKAETAELVVNTSAEADRVKAEADELIAKARTEADDAVAEAKAEADGILAEARAEAQDSLARSRTEAAERLQQLQEELATLQDQAEARMREIQANTEAIWKERRELLDDIRGMASGLVDSAAAAAARFPSREPAGPEEEMQEPQAGDETEPPGVATDEPTRPKPAVRSDEDEDGAPRDEVTERTASGQDM
jgi:DivIVA domain-containing protein